MLDTKLSVLVKLIVSVQFVVFHNVEPQSLHANCVLISITLCQLHGCI